MPLPEIEVQLSVTAQSLIISVPLTTLNHVCSDMGYEMDYLKLVDKLLDDHNQETGRTKLQQLFEDIIQELADDGELEEEIK